MPTHMDIRELPGRIDEAVALAAAGEEVVLLDGAAPRARLVPIVPGGERLPGLHAGAIQPGPDFDAPLPDDFWAGRP